MELIVSSMLGAALAFLGHLGMWAAGLASGAPGARPPSARNRPAWSSFPLTKEMAPRAPIRNKHLSPVVGGLTVKPMVGTERSGSDRAA